MAHKLFHLVFGGTYQLQAWFNSVGNNSVANLSSVPTIFLGYLTENTTVCDHPANSGDLDGSPGFGTYVVQDGGIGGSISIEGSVVGSSCPSEVCCTGLGVSKKRFLSSSACSGVAGVESSFLAGSFLGVWVLVRSPRMLSIEKLAILSFVLAVAECVRVL